MNNRWRDFIYILFNIIVPLIAIGFIIFFIYIFIDGIMSTDLPMWLKLFLIAR